MKQVGIGVTEVMISLFLSSLIFISLSQIYLSSKTQYQVSQTQIAEALDLEWVTALLLNSVRQAGFSPCMSLDYLIKNSEVMSRSLVIETLPTPALIIRRMDEQFNQVLAIKSPTQLLVTSHAPLPINHPIILADCYHAEVHSFWRSVNTQKGQLITLTKPLVFHYVGTIYLGSWIEEKWYTKQNTLGKQALYYKAGRSEELSSIIQALKIEEHQDKQGHWLTLVLSLASGKNKELVIGLRNL